MKKTGKAYKSTTLNEIINEWETGVKFLRAHYDLNHFVELILYNSNIYTREAPSYQGVVILDRFQVQYGGCKMNSKAFDIAFKKNKVLKKMNRGKLKLHNWLSKEDTLNVLEEIADLVSNLEHYRVADILTGDYKPFQLSLTK